PRAGRGRKARARLFLLHLRLDQIADGDRSRRLLVVLFHGGIFLLDLARLDGQAVHAVLAVDADDHQFHFVADVEDIASFLDAITADLGGLQHTIHAFGQGDDGFLGVDFLDYALHHAAFLVLT